MRETTAKLAPFLVLLLAVLGCVDSGRKSGSSLDSSPSSNTVRSPQLRLLSVRDNGSYGYHIVEGQVQNLSAEKMERVMAQVTFYDKSGNMVTSEDSLIEYDPLMPAQTSPFKVMIRANPAMDRYQIDFKYMLGETIDYERPDPPPPGKKKK